MPMRTEAWSPYRRSLGAAAWLCLAGSLLGSCRPEEAVQAAGPPVPCAATDAEIRRWIERPSLPDNPAGATPSCFAELAWQQLFAVTDREGPAAAPRFATWPSDQTLFPAQGQPPPWKTGPGAMKVRPLRKGLGMPGIGRVEADILTEAAALTPLTDQRGRWAHFSVVVDRQEYEYIRCCELYRGGCFDAVGSAAGKPPIAMPDGSLELKLAWRVLETCDLPDSPTPCTADDASRYLTVVTELEPYSLKLADRPVRATLGLVGMHIVQKTASYLDRIWATFEHVDNVPGCGQAGGRPAGSPGWSFYDPGCEDPTGAGHCADNSYCAPCPVRVPPEVAAAFNESHTPIPIDPATGEGVVTCTSSPIDFNRPVELGDGRTYMIHLFDPATCQADLIPTQACRATPIDAPLAGFNQRVRQILHGLGGSAAPLAHYELVGVLWYDGDTLQPPAGTALANTTMETFLQTLPQGCVVCHVGNQVNPVPDQPPMNFDSGLADRSMLFQQIRQYAGQCSADQQARCAAWAQGCPGG